MAAPPAPPPATVAAPPAPPPATVAPLPATVSPPPATSTIDGIDRSEWSKSLVAAHSYLMEKEWGPRCTALLSALVEHEWSFLPSRGRRELPKLRSRPTEYEDWMKEHRLMRDFKISPEFGDELFQWWKDPRTTDAVGERGLMTRGRRRSRSRVSSDWWSLDWIKLHKRGRNGIVLLVLGLAWQGQSICNAAAGDGLGAGEAALEANKVWQFMVEQHRVVLRDVLTQGRTGMEVLAAREEVEAKRAKKGSAKTKGKKPAASKTAAPQKEKEASRGKKRKHGELEGDHEDDLPLAKRAVPERPRPKPLKRG
ncbi:hypothetical protein B0H14DRAFT_3521139 [Mycena olivaceomarginata]|nr:hypothetical protein B0H14DRAFT_3521139 [Mycena olivaceomarginata]